ncbi:MAG: alpha/beta hydrolase [Limnohabitans sp.]|nr:alpha/beta hydrolase [Limnohabitans sp.]
MKLIQVNGVGLEIQLITPAHVETNRAPLVFLHEGLGSVAIWKSKSGDWPEQLCALARRPGVVYSRRGYGQSQSIDDVRSANRLKPDYLHQEAWTVLPALLQVLHIQSPVLLGHSDGASIALLYASRYKLSSCIAIAPHIMVEEISLQSIEKAKDAFMSGDLRARLQKFHANVDVVFWQWNDIWLSEDFRQMDLRPDCQRITSPVLAIQGLQDPYGTIEQINQIHTHNGLIERITLDDCGHSPHRDQAELTQQSIVQFLKDKP